MGRGDARTKRGKITRGSHGKSRPKLIKLKTLQKHQAKAAAPAA
jgi:ribosomal small subunit protein bTHX